MTEDLLRAALGAMVPLMIAETEAALSAGRCTVPELLDEARSYAQIIAEKGDLILFRSEKKGETARVVSSLARGLAIIAVVIPGGVTFLGDHWERPAPRSAT